MNYLIHPFRYIAGSKALLLGWVIMLISAVIAWQSGTHFDGVIDAHLGKAHAPVWTHFAEPLVNWLIMTMFFYTAGRIVSRSHIRLVDVAGTMALARAPMFFVAFLGFLPMPNMEGMAALENINGMVIAAGLIALLFAIWMIAWMYQAYTISCNVKGAKAVISFIITLLLAEVVSVSIFRSL